MSKRNKKIIKELQEQLQQKERQLQNMDVGFIAFIKSRIKKFLSFFSSLKIKSFKIKNLDLFKNYKITKLKIVLPSLCLLFVVGLVCFFAFAEPADQLPQNQTFLNLAHSHINASTTAPITYTSTSTQTTQADFEAVGSGGFGYSTSTTPGSIVGNDDLGVYRSAPIDLGLKTKLANAVITKGGTAKVFARSGSVASVSPVEVKRTTQAELEAGSGTGWIALANGSIASQGPELLVNGNMELNSNWFAYGAGISVVQVDAPHSGSYSFRGVDSSPPNVNKGIKSSPFTTITGRTYFITGWIWYNGGDNLGHDLYFGSGDGTILTYLQRRNPASNWLQYSAYYTETNGGNNAYVVVRHNSGIYRTFYIDDFSVKEIHTSSNYESDTLELSASAQGDRMLVQANVPAGTTLSYKIRSGETAIPDGSWSSWTTPVSVATGLNIFDIFALTGRYWRIGLDGATNGTATWTMGGFAVVPKPSDYSNLVEIVSATSTQVLPAEKYVQWLGFGADTWNVNDVSLFSKFTAIDLGKRYNSPYARIFL